MSGGVGGERRSPTAAPYPDWKSELQGFADELHLPISVCHFPPGTSKWNKVEHRLFSFISTNWRGEPLTDYETIVRLIAGTTTTKGLLVTCALDRRQYAVGLKITDAEMKDDTHRKGQIPRRMELHNRSWRGSVS